MIEGAGVEDGLGRFVGTQDHEQIADHGCLAFLVEFHHFLRFQLVESHFYHGDSAFDNLFSGRDYGRSLLATQHDGGYLRSVGEIIQSGLDNLDAGHCQAFVELLLELGVYFVARTAEGDLVVLAVFLVVGVAAGDFPQRGVALDSDKSVQGFCGSVGILRVLFDLSVGADGYRGGVRGVHVENGAIGVVDFPDKHHAYHHRVADLVIDLYRGDVHVADSERDFLFVHERIDPEIARPAESAAIFSEENHDSRLVRLLSEEADRENRHQQNGHAYRDAQNGAVGVATFVGEDESDGYHYRRNEQNDCRKHGESVEDHASVGHFLSFVL